jgi:hypothetical protein
MGGLAGKKINPPTSFWFTIMLSAISYEVPEAKRNGISFQLINSVFGIS